LWIKGWSFLSKMIDCPPLSEKLRQDPWIIWVPLGEDNDNVLVVERQGHGQMVSAKNLCIEHA
jgi:hypothetical protein